MDELALITGTRGGLFLVALTIILNAMVIVLIGYVRDLERQLEHARRRADPNYDWSADEQWASEAQTKKSAMNDD